MTILFLLALVASDAPASDAASAPTKLGSRNESCLATSDCASGLECRQEMCVLAGTGSSCRRAADCPGDLQCKQNQCLDPTAPLPVPAVTPATAPPLNPYLYAPYFMRSGIRYRDGMPIPPGMHVHTTSNVRLWVTGLSIWLSAWTGSWIMGVLGYGSPVTLIPILGSFLGAAAVPDYAIAPTLAAQIPFGIIQAVGGTLFLVGLLQKRKYLVFDKRAAITPVLTPQMQGLALTGTF